MPKVKLDDISIYYEIHGQGDPLILIAGLGSDISSWSSIINELSKHFQVIVFDNRGVGRSDTPSCSYSIQELAKDVVQLLRLLNMKKAHVLGHSLGGYVAQELAIGFSEYVDKLVLVSTASVSSVRNILLFEDMYRYLREGKNYESWIKRWTFWLFSPKTFTDNAFMTAFVKNAIAYPYIQSAAGFKKQIEAIASFDAQKRVDKIKTKTLAIVGSDDIVIYPREVKSLADKIPGSIYLQIKNTAHALHLENPGLFLQSVMSFLH